MCPKNFNFYIVNKTNYGKKKTLWNVVNDLLAVIINAFHLHSMNNPELIKNNWIERSEMNILASTN